jgi:hypothetical protein
VKGTDVTISSGYYDPAQAGNTPKNTRRHEFPATLQKCLKIRPKLAERLIHEHQIEEDRLIGRWRDLAGGRQP